MSELPLGWIARASAEVFEYVTSGSRGWAQYYATNGPLFVRIGNLQHGTIGLDLQDRQHVRPPMNAEGARTRLRAGDILISITADLGMVGLVPDDLGEAYINQHIALARPGPGLDARYLAWFFASTGKRQLLGMRRGVTKARLKRGWTPKKPAENAGLNQSEISTLENGAANPTYRTMQTLAAAVGGKIELVIGSPDE